MDYHLLSDFRREHQEALNELLTQIVATLLAENLVTLKEVAQDGVRIRTSAGSGLLGNGRPAPEQPEQPEWKRPCDSCPKCKR